MNPEGGEINLDKTLTLSRTNNPLVEKKNYGTVFKLWSNERWM